MRATPTAEASTSILDLALSSVAGALSYAQGAHGVLFRRVPEHGLTQACDAALASVSAIPSGVRLQLETDAPWIEIDSQLTVIDALGAGADPVFDAVIGGQVVASISTSEVLLISYDAATGEVGVREGGPATVRLQLPADGRTRPVEIWLPHAAGTELRDIRVPEHSIVAAWHDARPRWVHYGSSISQASEAESPAQTWTGIVARRGGLALTNLGLAGSCHLDLFMAQAIAALPADLISLKIGINIAGEGSMRERTFLPALHAFLDAVRRGHPDTPIVLASPIFCPFGEDRPGPFTATTCGPPGGLTLRRMRELIAATVGTRRDAGDGNLHLIDGLELLGPDEADLLPDDLHPDQAGYDLIADRFFERVFSPGAPAPVS